MAITLTKEVTDLLADVRTNKVLATVDHLGFPHAEGGVSLLAGEQGTLLYLESFESSSTNKNLVRSIWFDNRVAITLIGSAGESFQIKGKPVKVHITGPLFLKYYHQLRQHQGDVNLAAVWEIEPDEIINDGQAARRKHEEQVHPFFTHLDRLVR